MFVYFIPAVVETQYYFLLWLFCVFPFKLMYIVLKTWQLSLKCVFVSLDIDEIA